MEAAPAGLEPDEIGHVLAAQPGVVEVHDLHVWEVTSGFPALSAHVVVTGSEGGVGKGTRLFTNHEENVAGNGGVLADAVVPLGFCCAELSHLTEEREASPLRIG